MTMPNDPDLRDARLEVLRDRKGPYGVGFSGIDTSAVGQRPIIVRPDRLCKRTANERRYTVARRRDAESGTWRDNSWWLEFDLNLDPGKPGLPHLHIASINTKL